MCSPKILLLVFVVACIFFHYRSFSPCWPLLADREHFSFSYRLYEIFMFFFSTKFVTFFFTRSSSFSVIHVSANIEKLSWKRLDFVVVFSKSPCNHAIFRQKHLELPVVLYLLTELFYIGFPVVRTDRLSGVRSRDYQNFSDGWITTIS